MRILGLSESGLFEQTMVTVILMPDMSQVYMGGPFTLSAAPGASEHIQALWQQQDSHQPMPRKQLSFKKWPTHFSCEGPGSEYFQLCGSEFLDAEAQGWLLMTCSEYFPDLLQGSESPS